MINKPTDLTFMAHLTEVSISVRDVIFRFLFDMAVLPYEAFKFTDAVIRTLWRMIVLHRKLLEWTPSANASIHSQNDVWSVYKAMWIAPLVAVAYMGLIIYSNPGALFIAAPILSLWLFSPSLAWFLSKPQEEHRSRLSDEQILFLHKSARKTWLFFEQFVTARENWLPPDNFHEQPVATIAHRKSYWTFTHFTAGVYCPSCATDLQRETIRRSQDNNYDYP